MELSFSFFHVYNMYNRTGSSTYLDITRGRAHRPQESKSTCQRVEGQKNMSLKQKTKKKTRLDYHDPRLAFLKPQVNDLERQQ